jgi:hypothetical protein
VYFGYNFTRCTFSYHPWFVFGSCGFLSWLYLVVYLIVMCITCNFCCCVIKVWCVFQDVWSATISFHSAAINQSYCFFKLFQVWFRHVMRSVPSLEQGGHWFNGLTLVLVYCDPPELTGSTLCCWIVTITAALALQIAARNTIYHTDL